METSEPSYLGIEGGVSLSRAALIMMMMINYPMVCQLPNFLIR